VQFLPPGPFFAQKYGRRACLFGIREVSCRAEKRRLFLKYLFDIYLRKTPARQNDEASALRSIHDIRRICRIFP